MALTFFMHFSYPSHLTFVGAMFDITALNLKGSVSLESE